MLAPTAPATRARPRITCAADATGAANGRDLPHTRSLRVAVALVTVGPNGGGCASLFPRPAGEEAVDINVNISADPASPSPSLGAAIADAASAHTDGFAVAAGECRRGTRYGPLAWLRLWLRGTTGAPDTEPTSPPPCNGGAAMGWVERVARRTDPVARRLAAPVEPIPGWAEASAEPVQLTVVDWHRPDSCRNADADVLLLAIQLDVRFPTTTCPSDNTPSTAPSSCRPRRAVLAVRLCPSR